MDGFDEFFEGVKVAVKAFISLFQWKIWIIEFGKQKTF